MKKLLVATFLCAFVLLPALGSVSAQSGSDNTIIGGLEATNLNSTLGQQTDLKAMIGEVIKFLLGFLAIVFVILILYAGFTWMTAGGDSGKVDTAKKLIINAIIGVIIVLAAYGITHFIIQTGINATNGTSTQ